MKMTGAQLIIECLLEQGVDTVFGYPGGAVLNIYDALYQNSHRLRHIMTAHEQGAAHAADGYTRSTGRTGVVIATSGPGATNLVTGLATAHMDSIPLVAITGNVAVDLLGRDSFQEVNITEITKPITKFNHIVKDIRELAPTLREAFSIASSGRPGPVLVDVPKDITAQQYDYTPPTEALAPVPKKTDDFPGLDRLAARLEKAERPLIYAGGGVILSNASPELLALAERTDSPVCTSIMGLGGFPAGHPLSFGLIGMHGSYAAGQATQACDLLLVAGARFSDRVAGDTKRFAPNAEIVHLDIDPKEINKNVTCHDHIVGDLKQVLSGLNRRLSPKKRPEWVARLTEWQAAHPQEEAPDNGCPSPAHVIRAAQAHCNPGDIIVTDVGQHQMWTAQTYRFTQPRTFLTSGGLGTMGYGLGAAIGAQTAHPGRKVVLFTGDGSFHMNQNELVTLASYDLPVVVVVMNNTVLGMVRQWQKLFYGRRFSETDPHRKTDFKRLAEAFGVAGLRVEKTEELEEVLEEAFSLRRPVVVDCHLSPDANVLPMIPPGGSAADIVVSME